MRDVRCDYLAIVFFPSSLYGVPLLSSLLPTSFPFLHERLTFVPSGTAIMRFPGLMSTSFGLSFVLSFFLLQSWNFVDLSSVPSPGALFPYHFPCLFNGDMTVYDSSLWLNQTAVILS